MVFSTMFVHTAVSLLTTAPSRWQDDKHRCARVYRQPQRQSAADRLSHDKPGKTWTL